MADEKKDELVQGAAGTPGSDVTAQPAAKAAAPAAQAVPVKEEKKEAAATRMEKPTNCTACKKSIKNKRNYYRNGKYYCTKRCWSTTKTVVAKKEEAPA